MSESCTCFTRPASGVGPDRCTSPVLRRSTAVRRPSPSSTATSDAVRSCRVSARSSTPGRVVRPSTVGRPPRSRALTAPSSESQSGARTPLEPELARHQHELDLGGALRSEEHTSELQSRQYLVCRLLLETKKK